MEIVVFHLIVDGYLQISNEFVKWAFKLVSNPSIIFDLRFLIVEIHIPIQLGKDSDLIVLCKVEKNIFVVAQFPLSPDVDLLFDQVKNQLLQIINLNEACSVWIIFGPGFEESIACLLTHSGLLLLCSLQLTFEDNRDEQIQEDQRYDKSECDEVDVGHRSATAVDSISLLLLVCLLIDALESYVSLAGAVVHDLLPALTRSNPEQSHQSRSEVLKVGMVIQVFLQTDPWKQEDTKDRKEEQE